MYGCVSPKIKKDAQAMKRPDYFHKGQQPRRSKGDLNSSVATRLDTPNADSIETTRIPDATMRHAIDTQDQTYSDQTNQTQSRGIGR